VGAGALGDGLACGELGCEPEPPGGWGWPPPWGASWCSAGLGALPLPLAPGGLPGAWPSAAGAGVCPLALSGFREEAGASLEVDVPAPFSEPSPLSAACSARVLSIWVAEVMKSCQINAGNVPPSTGPPLKSLVIGTSLFG
jgi:hypothetical protein